MLYTVDSREELAQQLQIPLQLLTYVLYGRGTETYYHTFEIPKKSGGVRTIHAPDGELKDIQRRLAEFLWEHHCRYQKKHHISANVSHAFQKQRGILTNASAHRNRRYVVNIDLEDFFDAFHFGRVMGFFEKNRAFGFSHEAAVIIAQLACYEGKLPQGAPSSPVITNLISELMDMKLMGVAKKYRMRYTRYADDLTFSTNDKHFLSRQADFLEEVTRQIHRAGFHVNEKKTRMTFSDARQSVTGLVVNQKINVPREYYKTTRAMADALYCTGAFQINGVDGTIEQLEGRFSFINQVDFYNNRRDGKKHNFQRLNAHEREYRRFLFYRLFYANPRPLIVTEGKTDIVYLKSALKKDYRKYPALIKKTEKGFVWKVAFLKKTKYLAYLMNLQQDGADTMKNIVGMYRGSNNLPNLYADFEKKCPAAAQQPVILLFDNEQKSRRPLKIFLDFLSMKGGLGTGLYKRIEKNLFVMTVPLQPGKEECEMEDLFPKSVQSHVIEGKHFSRAASFDTDKYYGKARFAAYVERNYQTIDFSGFEPVLRNIEKVMGVS